MVRHPVKQNISWWLSWVIPPAGKIDVVEFLNRKKEYVSHVLKL